MAFTEFFTNFSTGSNLNAGSTENGTAAFTYASGNWVQGTGVFTVASGNPQTDGVAVGDFASVYADGSTVTGFVGRVTARDTTTITVSLTAKMGSAPTDGTGNRTLKIGGCWKGPNATVDFPFDVIQNTLTNASGHFPRVNMKNNAQYDITAAIVPDQAGPITIEGYTTTAGDGGQAVIDGGAPSANFSMLTPGGNADGWRMVGITIQNSGTTSNTNAAIAANASATGWLLHRCKIGGGHRGNGVKFATNWEFSECEITGCNTSNTAGLGGLMTDVNTFNVKLFHCYVHDNTGNANTGLYVNGQPAALLIDHCIFDTNGLSGIELNGGAGLSLSVLQSDFYNNGTHGIWLKGTATPMMFMARNCNFTRNQYGIRDQSTGNIGVGNIMNCGFGTGTEANTTANVSTSSSALVESGSVSYPSNQSPWADAANGDFDITLAEAKNAGRGSFLGTTSTAGQPDIGAAQAGAAAGGGARGARQFHGAQGVLVA